MGYLLEDWQKWLYGRLQAYEQLGRKALHPTLEYMEKWDAALGHPHKNYPIIHVAGTNGKGSTAAFLASILRVAGYKVGLHTSPHLWYFTERMRVNGELPPEEWVGAFLEKWHSTIEVLNLSFFEATVGMSFAWFAEAQVDVAVVEVGLGGRWDATNIISPELSVITSIGWDHMDILGPTLSHIALEKAGIIKVERPVIIAPNQPPEAVAVFQEVSRQKNAPLYCAESCITSLPEWVEEGNTLFRQFRYQGTQKIFLSPLTGSYQADNLSTVVSATQALCRLNWKISEEALYEGIKRVRANSGLRGRAEWIKVGERWVLLD
ncbi:MAG: Mur ligase family protein, partial [Bacteroidia bacterium]|nr:Mur ligase family protein [Bacteroidia bacterium]MDW8134489.1 Mur ligase family protein [Bacteroidia bacterium]